MDIAWLTPQPAGFHMLLAMISTRELDAVGFHGVIIGPGDHCQAHVLAAAQDEGVKRADAGTAGVSE